MALDLGDRLSHVHLADGTDSPRDEHFVPGRGNQPVAQVLTQLAGRGFTGAVIAEISTRRAPDRASRLADLAETLEFARRHLGQLPGQAPSAP
jgi:sugar phosphate isomerase/epimerase